MALRVNRSCTITVTLLVTLTLVVSVSSQYLHILPHNSSGNCSDFHLQNESCLTLADVGSSVSEQNKSSITLNFLPGNHILTQRVIITNVMNLVLSGHMCDGSQSCETKIKCQGASGFEFQNIHSINITGLEFTECGGQGINGGVLSVSNVTVLSIQSCNFFQNRVSGLRAVGGAIFINTTFDVSIHSSSFINNSAECMFTNQSCIFPSVLNVGGAIFILDVQKAVQINSCYFKENHAFTGGAITSLQSPLVVSNTTFVHNNADSDIIGFGGAIYSEKSNLTVSSNQFISNTAEMDGGAISVSESLLFISDTHFVSNNAHRAGGAVSLRGESNLTSSHTYLNSNVAQYGGAIYIVQSCLAEASAHYYNNEAIKIGGAICVEEGNISSLDCFYANNTGKFGGAISLSYGNLSSNKSSYQNNLATKGGAVYIYQGSFTTFNVNYTRNTALAGGAIFAKNGSIWTLLCDFKSNVADVGGAIWVEQGIISISRSTYTRNFANVDGGAVHINESYLTSISNIFKNNTASNSGGAISSYNSSLLSSNSSYLRNIANAGGAIISENGNILSNNTFYELNEAFLYGGAIYTSDGNVVSNNSQYIMNKAGILGGAILSFVTNSTRSIAKTTKKYSVLNITQSSFLNNEATQGGGALVILALNRTSVIESEFKNNIASYGGAILAKESSVFYTFNTFTNNSAKEGGAIVVISSTMSITFNCYTNNRGDEKGGAVRVIESNVTSSDNQYANNSAFDGGAVYIGESSFVFSSYDTYANNSAYMQGGAVSGNTSSISCNNNTYSNNSAQQGAAIYMEYSTILITRTCFEMNIAITFGGAINILYVNISISETYFQKNIATIFQGGTMYVINGTVSISGSYFLNNQARNGGTIFVQNGSVYITSCSFSNNIAYVTGGVIYADSSSINSVKSNYTSNTATALGGVFFISQSSLQTSQNNYTNNTAIQNGGVLCTQCVDSEHNHTCTFLSVGNSYMRNSAQAGGAIRADNYHVNSTSDYFYQNVAYIDGGAMLIRRAVIFISKTSFSNNYNADLSFGAGGAIYTDYSSVSISYTVFTNNTSGCGGAIYCDNASMSFIHSTYTNNIAQEGGAICVGNAIQLTCSNSFFMGNTAFAKAGAISVRSGNFNSRGCHFKNNQAKFQGGALLIAKGNVSSINSFYTNNVANGWTGGAIYVERGSVSTTGSNYTRNYGGAIFIDIEGSIFSSDSTYVNNTGKVGGAMYVNQGNVYSKGSQYLNNIAVHGGAIYGYGGYVSCANSYFTFNSAVFGGAIFAWTNSNVSSIGCVFEDNIASRYGGAICSYSDNHTGVVNSHNSRYTNNYSDLGGAIFVIGRNISTVNSSFENNTVARAGGAICGLLSNIFSANSYYGNNHADQHGGAIFIGGCTQMNNLSFLQPHTSDDKLGILLANTKLICTENVLVDAAGLYSTVLEFSGRTLLSENSCGLIGGAVMGVQVNILINGRICAIVSGNVATYGSGFALHAGSTLNINSPIEMKDNKASQSGGGIFSYMSDIHINLRGSQDAVSINNNIVSQNGGGMYTVHSNVTITNGIMHFENNIASKGAALLLEQNSKIILQKERQDTRGQYNLKLEFVGNHAQYGGALYIPDNREGDLACNSRAPGSELAQTLQECFIQTILLKTNVSEHITEANYINVFFTNNTASVSGRAIYGGLLDRCLLSNTTELLKQFPQYQQLNGFDYIKATAQFTGLIDYDNLTTTDYPDRLINGITSTDVEGIISSEPVQVCFCLDNVHNCSYDHPNVFTKKGHLFQLSVVAVDQVGNPVNATIISSFISNNGNLNIDQARQKTTTHCTELEYNVYPKSDSTSSQIELYAEGPCRDIGISKRILNVFFLPCTCPIGFQPLETETLCTCDCDQLLRPTYITNCSYATETVLRNSNAWIDYVNTTTKPGYLIYPNCPYDYCVDTPVNINLNVPSGADVQCAVNRSGKLCGKCKKNLSLVMGSSRCQECSSNFLSIIIPFAIAGIALVAFILILNVTVSIGTIHGLTFYANILVASQSAFIPLNTSNVLIIFISWINLDLGIETCFYDGMDSYAKVLLQLAFPAYIILLTIVVIIISEYSIRFSTLIGKKDPVATLCTLILLSYSKLIRTIITSLQYTYLDYPDNSREVVWLYDANVPYFTPSHIPRFITAIAIVIIGTVYTLLVLLGQWIQQCGDRRFLKCFNNPKYNEFIKKYHAPFNPKNRYWVGLLLLTRIVHYIVSAFVTDGAMLLSVMCITVGLVIFKLINTVILRISTYKSWPLDCLEVTFFTNLLIFTAATYYVRENGGDQQTLATTSLSLSLIIFVGILLYHFYTYILKYTQCWGRIMQGLAQAFCNRQRHNNHVRLPLEEDQEEIVEDNVQDEQIIEMQPLYTGDRDTDSVDLPHQFDPPVIVPAVRYDQPREPALDIIDPITTDDYRQLNRPPAPRRQQVPTMTVIDITANRETVL